jgi:hypothetical protein
MIFFRPDFETDCRLCGTSPCVRAEGHPQPDTDLCGVCFFDSPDMNDWNDWNTDEETEDELSESD